MAAIHADSRSFWSLQETPFDDDADPRFFFASRAHAESLARLAYLVRHAKVHFGLLTGELGAGKSIVCTTLTHRLSDRDTFVLYLPSPLETFEPLLASIVRGLALESGRELEIDTMSEWALLEAYSRLANEALLARRRRLVVLIDEAQQLSDEALNRLRSLSNLGRFGPQAGVGPTGRDGASTDVPTPYPATFILVGQPELRPRLKQLPALNQRVAIRFHLGYLTADEVPRYLRHRLQTAGHPTGDIFAPGALDALTKTTLGIPREINRFARLVMDNAMSRGATVVDAVCVEEILADQRQNDGDVVVGG